MSFAKLQIFMMCCSYPECFAGGVIGNDCLTAFCLGHVLVLSRYVPHPLVILVLSLSSQLQLFLSLVSPYIIPFCCPVSVHCDSYLRVTFLVKP